MSFPARFSGPCSDCDESIRPGQEILYGDDGLVAHLVCPTPAAPCPACHLVPSVSGRCGCDD